MQTEDQILEGAMRCFWLRGLAGSSVTDLVKATGAQRSTLYRAHTDKIGLFLASMEHYASFRMAPLDPNATLPQQVRQWLEASLRPYDQQDVPFGCLLISTASAYSSHEPRVQQAVQHHLGLLRAFFAAAVGIAHPGEDVARRAAVLMAANTAVFVLSRCQAPREELIAIIEDAVARAFES